MFLTTIETAFAVRTEIAPSIQGHVYKYYYDECNRCLFATGENPGKFALFV